MVKHDILVVRTIAKAVSVSNFTKAELGDFVRAVCPNAKSRWLKPLVETLCETFSTGPRPMVKDIEEVMAGEGAFQRALQGKAPPAVTIEGLCELPRPEMRPASSSLINAPSIRDFSELATILELHPDDLGWLTAPAYLGFSHYHCNWHEKKTSSEGRLIESPKPLLKLTQELIHKKILYPLPLHEAASGFVPGKSIFDYVAPHTGQRMVLKLDLKDFFPSITASRVIRLFMAVGYPESVSRLLAFLTTHRTPKEAFEEKYRHHPSRSRFEKPHLPQGAPTSPSLANLSAFRLDCRLAGLARASGIRYTRYADDLLFSGDDGFRRTARNFYYAALAIIIEEGFQPNLRKTRFMPAGQRQHAAGLVLNQKPNVRRKEYDRIKALLTNSCRHGPESQNQENLPHFKEHLAGRIGWIRQSNPKRAAHLESLFERIDWDR